MTLSGAFQLNGDEAGGKKDTCEKEGRQIGRDNETTCFHKAAFHKCTIKLSKS